MAIGSLKTEVPPEIGSYFAQYVVVQWNDGERIKDKVPIGLIDCDPEIFKSGNDQSGRRETPKYEMLKCLDKGSFEHLNLRGNFFAYNFSYIELGLNLCLGTQEDGTPCASQEEIEAFFDWFTVEAAFVNSLVNLNEELPAGALHRGDQVLPVIDDSNYFPVDLNVLNRANLFVKEAKYQTFESIVSTQTKVKDFHLVDQIDRRTESYNLADEIAADRKEESILKIYVRLDKEIDHYVRTMYGLFDMLSDVGGVASVIYVITRAVAHRISHNLLLASLMQVMFRAKTLKPCVKDENDGEEEDVARKKSGSNETVPAESGSNIEMRSAGRTEFDFQRRESRKEKMNYIQLRNRIQDKAIEEEDIDNMIEQVRKTKPISFRFIDHVMGLWNEMKCPALCRCGRKDKQFRVFKRGKQIIEKNLDIIDLVERRRAIQILTLAVLSKKQRVLALF